MTIDKPLLTKLSARIVAAYVGNHHVATPDLPGLIFTVSAALAHTTRPQPVAIETERKPAVPIRKSVMPEAIVCLECGQTNKMLKRHLGSEHGLTPDEYRAKWHLPRDYPMTAPAYSEQRSAFAKSTGLGHSRKGKWYGKRT